MSYSSVPTATIAATLVPSAVDPASAIVAAARLLLPHLERGRRIDAPMLRAAMESAFGASDADGAWTWKAGYDACEAATVDIQAALAQSTLEPRSAHCVVSSNSSRKPSSPFPAR
jgi:hypothetical protein